MSQYEGELAGVSPEEEDRHAVRMGDSDDEDDVYDQSTSKLTEDTSAMDVKKGKDIQGIPWERMSNTRDMYRQTRLKQYANFENIPNSGRTSEKECTPVEKGKLYYEFQYNTRSVKSTILHFQLRNLVWATTRHDVYLMSNHSVLHWSALTREKHEVIDLQGHVAPSEKHQGNFSEGFYRTQVSTLAVKNNLLVTGGFHGEIICKFLDRKGISYCCKSTHDDNGITNSLEIFQKPSGSVHFLASNNDCGVRDFDMEKFQICNHFRFAWAVNHTSLSPDGKLAVIAGDDPDGLLVDANSGKTVHDLRGHLDFSFASAWNPDGRTFATGNQDKTCRVWDIRNLSKSVAVLGGNIGAIRSIRYTSDGRFMAMAEPADFIHIFDVASGYSRKQELDFFGEIAGISFSPDTEALFVGVHDRTYSSLLQFNRRRFYSYLDSAM
ncbi:uncharacterized WD repeat-containing protein C2A9.03-like [Phragmites australis]|uniref:uncharacterized WD repeat-containing protein C2A9.03-like n=1 Tax=Phragmites australis TaxID=29695 RepID=UPI002D76847E|nr:uncharacterized WD repeat-containing protein C2A9.03-like [Phragmites australis]XP_062195379.1 uncharacterized WD repeat-containing protein C2A9.03-like [Phragmites australis]